MTPQSVENAEKFPGAAGKPPATILVVDDESLTCWSIAEVLGEHGYRVRKASDASSALQAIASADARPDLVLLDMRLPDSHDLTVLSVIHRSFPRLPVVLMTAHGSPALSADARRRGAVAVVNKPFEIHALPLMVEGILAGAPA
jgi:DNA-binding NtrC family response regulator